MLHAVNLLLKMDKYIKELDKIISTKPKVCIVLGSGLNNFTSSIIDKKILHYNNIPGFYNTSVSGHKGQFIFGYINNTPILCAEGRFHYYEGYSFDEVGIIMKIFNYYNPDKYIITNSCGCLRLDWKIGSFMLVKKFIDFSFINSNTPIIYNINNNLNLADDLNIKSGTYTYTTGPTYETKAEIEEIINIGGDAVGMSTFPEYLTCKKLNIKPIIIACLTNYGAGLIKKEKVLHKDVLKNAENVKTKFNILIKKIIQNIAHQRKQKI